MKCWRTTIEQSNLSLHLTHTKIPSTRHYSRPNCTYPSHRIMEPRLTASLDHRPPLLAVRGEKCGDQASKGACLCGMYKSTLPVRIVENQPDRVIDGVVDQHLPSGGCKETRRGFRYIVIHQTVTTSWAILNTKESSRKQYPFTLLAPVCGAFIIPKGIPCWILLSSTIWEGEWVKSASAWASSAGREQMQEMGDRHQKEVTSHHTCLASLPPSAGRCIPNYSPKADMVGFAHHRTPC